MMDSVLARSERASTSGASSSGSDNFILTGSSILKKKRFKVLDEDYL